MDEAIKLIGMRPTGTCEWACKEEDEIVFVFEQKGVERCICPHCIAGYLTCFGKEIRMGHIPPSVV